MAIYKTQIKITNLQSIPKKQGASSICCSEPLSHTHRDLQLRGSWDRDSD